MPPAVLTRVTASMAVMQQEIFGPLLPVIPYEGISAAIDFINARPRPLALYAFGPADASRRQLLAATTSGTVAINDTILQYAQDDLPFGGVGPSGTGRYHGREGFEALSNVRPVFEQARCSMAGLARPPFGRAARLVLRWLIR
jgi:coniferyl-aldehyde dehydrogenase